MRLGSKLVVALFLFAGLVLANFIASSFSLRMDMTEEKVYTLSPGTKAILDRIEEPISLEFHFSRSVRGLPIAYKNYAGRVQELLREYARASNGSITFHVIDPRPDTPEERRSASSGLMSQILPSGDQIYFGVVAMQADQQRTINSFNPQRERFLEQDISNLIHTVQQFEKKKLGLLTGVHLIPPTSVSARQKPELPHYVIGEWERSFDIVIIAPTATGLPDDLDALAIVHPPEVSPPLQFAIDQFLLGGRPVFLAVDPSYYNKRRSGRATFGGGSEVTSDAPWLLNTHGIVYDSQGIVGDHDNAAEVQTNRGTVLRMPLWVNLRRANFNSRAMTTAHLNTAMFVEPGSLAARPGSPLTFTPLIESSAATGTIPTAVLQFTEAQDIPRQIEPTGKKTLAALVTGKFKTAFPAGMPHQEKLAPSTQTTTAVAGRESLAESSTTSTLFVVADADFLLDENSVRKAENFGRLSVEAINDNVAFAANVMEFLCATPDLLSIRGKGSSLRPFEIVQQMETAAHRRYQEKLGPLTDRLDNVQKQIAALRAQPPDAGQLGPPPAVMQAIEDFRKQESALQAEAREMRRVLREDIDALENKLLVVNLLATPLLVAALGLRVYHSRRTRVRPAESHVGNRRVSVCWIDELRTRAGFGRMRKFAPLALGVGALAVIAGSIIVIRRPAATHAPDARVGQPLADAAILRRAATVRLTQNGQVVVLAKSAAHSEWSIVSHHGLRAELAKLTAFVDDLATARIQRLVTRNPDRLAHLQLDDTHISFADAAGRELWSAALGKNAALGGRFVRFGNEPKAYLTDTNVWFDADPKQWLDFQLVRLNADDVARVEVSFPTDVKPVTATRIAHDAPFASANASDGTKLNQSEIAKLLEFVTSVRFIEIADHDEPSVREALEHASNLKLVTFDGQTVELSFGRTSARRIAKIPPIGAKVLQNAGPANAVGSMMEELPPGPAYVSIVYFDSNASIDAPLSKHAFRISDQDFAQIRRSAFSVYRLPPGNGGIGN